MVSLSWQDWHGNLLCSCRSELWHGGGSIGPVRLQGIPQYTARAITTTAAAGADAELRAQFPQAAAAFGNGRANIALANGIADADDHARSYLVKISLPWRVRRKR